MTITGSRDYLDPGLSVWAARLGTTGAHDPALASSHFEDSLAPKVWSEFDCVLGEPLLHVRVPGTWSSNRVARFVALYDNPVRQMLRGPGHKGGRPRKSDCKRALDEARAFDATLTRRLPRKTARAPACRTRSRTHASNSRYGASCPSFRTLLVRPLKPPPTSPPPEIYLFSRPSSRMRDAKTRILGDHRDAN